jgi:hypothetical protein
VQLGRGTIFWSHHKTDQQRAQGLPLDANVHPEGLTLIPTPPSQIQQDHPHPNIKKSYGAKEQFVKPINKTPLLDKAGNRFTQEVTGVFLFLA